MNRPSVWAPHAHEVDIVTERGDRVPAEPVGGDWFRCTVDLGEVGYRISLDGDGGLPDPRSRWQPEGVHGPSFPFDAQRYRWHADNEPITPFRDAVIYELHVGTFTAGGTYATAAERLEHLVELGVTHIELMPVNSFEGEHGWGYDGVALYAPHAPYGTPAALQAFVDECHHLGLGVILDVVYNHLGPSGNHLQRFGPYFTDRHHTPWGSAVNVDGPRSDEVRRFFIDNAVMWLRDYHFDGLRLDAMHAVVDMSSVHLLEELRDAVREVEAKTGRTRALIVEYDDNQPRLVAPVSRGGFELDAKWNDDFHHALHTALTGERNGYYEDFHGLADVATAMRNGWVYQGERSLHRQHRHGRPLRATADPDEGPHGDALVVYQQNHDQVGNRPVGDRIGELAGTARQKVGAALVLLSPFTPMLFQGEEWAASSPFPYFADHLDPELVDAVRRGRREELATFGWSADSTEHAPDPEDRSTFDSAVLQWKELECEPHAGMLEWYRTLISLRRGRPALRDHRLDGSLVTLDEPRQVLTIMRDSHVIVANLGRATAEVRVAAAEAPEGFEVLAASDPAAELRDDHVRVPANSVAVLAPKPQETAEEPRA